MKSFAANHFYRGGGNRKSWDEMNPARDTQVIDCLEPSFLCRYIFTVRLFLIILIFSRLKTPLWVVRFLGQLLNYINKNSVNLMRNKRGRAISDSAIKSNQILNCCLVPARLNDRKSWVHRTVRKKITFVFLTIFSPSFWMFHKKSRVTPYKRQPGYLIDPQLSVPVLRQVWLYLIVGIQ